MKTFVWVAGDHAALVIARNYDQALRQVIAEIMYSGCYIAAPSAQTEEDLKTLAVEIFENNVHKIHEITETTIARAPFRGQLNF
jgi:hypothetical protein